MNTDIITSLMKIDCNVLTINSEINTRGHYTRACAYTHNTHTHTHSHIFTHINWSKTDIDMIVESSVYYIDIQISGITFVMKFYDATQ